MKLMQRMLALVAMLFGVATLIAGGRVLLGADPGYAVYLPLLVYNTVMGLAYVAAGLVGWPRAALGRNAAAIIFVLNGLVLAGVGYLHARHGNVAIQSIQAMALRTGVWLVLFLGFWWMARRQVSAKGGFNP